MEKLDVYCDQSRINVSPYTVTLTLAVSSPDRQAGGTMGHDLVTVRMSPQHAKTMAMSMRRVLKEFERNSNTPIAIPQELMNQLGMSMEDW